MKGIIIYKSIYGSTRQFSEWLHADTGFALHTIATCPKDLSRYGAIVLGSSVHHGLLSLREYLVANWPHWQHKTVVIMLTSGTGDVRFLDKVIARSLPDDIVSAVKVFPVGGRYLFAKMNFIDRRLIKIVAHFTSDAETKKGMLLERDEVERKNLNEIVAFLQALVT